ncbi:MAG: hypothetical protein U9R79_05935 [Armatimonadota bacterium]|nr:hypothetical protein [Armatimonadota bacterium]
MRADDRMRGCLMGGLWMGLMMTFTAVIVSEFGLAGLGILAGGLVLGILATVCYYAAQE